jgi:hypothetical protein
VELLTTTNGVKQRFFFDDAKIELDYGKGAKSYALTDITRVSVSALGSLRMCELCMRDGAKPVLSTGTPTLEFKSFVEALHQRIAALDTPVAFVRGSWLIMGTLAVIGVLAIALGALLYFDIITPPAMFRGKGMILGAAWILLGPALLWRSRPRPYDPRAPLDVLA